jgi:hypothetical protein
VFSVVFRFLLCLHCPENLGKQPFSERGAVACFFGNAKGYEF